jgi:acetyltransferase-like isoleucine patch superfamily enzyme
MSFLQILNKFNSAINTSYTLMVRSSFEYFGKSSRIGSSAKLIEPRLIYIGDEVTICDNVWLNAKDDRGDGRVTLSIGNGSYIGRFSQINAWRNVVIGCDVLIGDRVYIGDAEHNFKDMVNSIKRQGDTYVDNVELCDGCWVGVGATILPGVRIGKNSIITANSVVTQNVPDFSIAGGNPAKIIRKLQKV